MTEIIETYHQEETRELGRRLGTAAKPGQVYALDGDLGAGKTVFAQGFAEGLGIVGPVNSPTFTILQTYETGRLPLYHMDVYRLEDEEELEAIGADEYLGGDGVCLVEWSSRVSGLLPPDTVSILIERDYGKGEDYRRIRLQRQEDLS